MRVSYLGNRRSEDNDFIKLSNSLHELIHTRSFYDIDIVVVTLNLNRYREVGLVKNLLNGAVRIIDPPIIWGLRCLP